MTTPQTVSALVLWLLVLVLCAFVILLYREVDLAYGKATRISRPGLPVGSAFPSIDVVEPLQGEEALELGTLSGRGLIAVVSSTCTACIETVSLLFERSSECHVVVLVTGAGRRFEEYESDPRGVIRWISNPGDVIGRLKVNVVPSLFALVDGAIVDSTTDGSHTGISSMIDALRRAEGEQASPLLQGATAR